MKKKIMLIVPDFYSYGLTIEQSLERKGYIVEKFDDRPGKTFFLKALIRLNRRFAWLQITKYQNKIIRKLKEDSFSFLIIIDGQSFFSSFFKRIKKEIPNLVVIYYLWDSISTFPYFKKNIVFCNHVFSFDPNDSRNFGFSFLPLFSSNYSLDNQNLKIKYDYSVLMTAKPGKMRQTKKAISFLNQNHLHGFVYIYIQSPIILLYYKFRYKEFREFKKEYFHYKRVSFSDACKITKESKYIIDCPQNGQVGLTIRTIEALSAQKKLITFNKDIVNYDFYSKQNVLIPYSMYNNSNLFFNTPFKEIKDSKQLLNVDQWTERLLQDK